MNLLINFFTVVLIIVSVLLVLVVLMQKAKSDGGVAAMGSGTMESTFGAESNNVLFNITRTLAIIFFLLSFGLYLAHIYQAKHQSAVDNKLIPVTAPATNPAPSTPAPAQGEPKNP